MWENYRTLYDALLNIRKDLMGVDRKDLVKLMTDAASNFGMNTGGEFVSEAYTALQVVLENKDRIPCQAVRLAEKCIQDIEFGWHRAKNS